MENRRFEIDPRISTALILLVLAIMITYHVGFFFVGPFPGFVYDTVDGQVLEIFVESETELQIGDIISTIGGMALEDSRADPIYQIWEGLDSGDSIAIRVEREGVPVDIIWTYPGRTQGEFIDRVTSQWFLAYFFWIAGLIAFLFVRPRDTFWQLITFFNLFTALWFTTGSGPSRLHIWGSVVFTRAGVWLTIPVLLHLHWIFPKRFSQVSKRSENILMYSIYGLSFAFLAYNLIRPEDNTSYQYGLVFSLLVSAVLLILHYLLQKDTRDQIKIILRVTLLAFFPVLITVALSLITDIPTIAWGASVIGLPFISFGYFYAIAQGRLTSLEFRANRAVTSILYVIIMLPVLILIYSFIETQLNARGLSPYISVVFAFVAAFIAYSLFPRFQSFTNRRIFGIAVAPSELLQSYSAQITTSQDTANLSSLFNNLILPSLLVRQSALISIENENRLKVISMNGLVEDQLPSLDDIDNLIPMQNKLIFSDEMQAFPRKLNWIKVVLPLTFDDKFIGMWLLGRRDPNDHYDDALIEMLKSLAHQTSLALINHHQTQRLRALYQLNIDRHENERARLARELHDETLNNLALLQRETQDPDASRDIDELITNLRETIHGLRPEMLSYGLLTALQDLGDTLSERQSDTDVRVSLQGTLTPINPNIELHLFRIVQQACENALRHAKADYLLIEGEILEDRVFICVEDNGIGFEIGEELSLSNLLADQRFGLAGMHERADLIDAKIKITSQAEMGTTVIIDWKK